MLYEAKKTSLQANAIPPPFENLMPYVVMKGFTKDMRRCSSKESGNKIDNLFMQDKKVSCQDKLKTHSEIVSQISSLSAPCSDKKTKDVYKTKKMLIDRAESLEELLQAETTLLNHCDDSCTGLDSSSIESNSTDSDSLGDEGYSTDNQSNCTGTNVFRRLIGSRAVSDAPQGVSAIVTKPGILKSCTSLTKSPIKGKKVTFEPQVKKIASHSVKKLLSSSTAFEQKLKTLTIICEGCESGLSHDCNSPLSKGSQQLDSAAFLPKVADQSDAFTSPFTATSKQITNGTKLTQQNYENVSFIESACLSKTNSSKLDKQTKHNVQFTSCDDVVKTAFNDLNTSAQREVNNNSSKLRSCRTMSDVGKMSVSSQSNANFAKSSDILNIFQTHLKTKPVDLCVQCGIKLNQTNYLVQTSRTTDYSNFAKSNCVKAEYGNPGSLSRLINVNENRYWEGQTSLCFQDRPSVNITGNLTKSPLTRQTSLPVTYLNKTGISDEYFSANHKPHKLSTLV